MTPLRVNGEEHPWRPGLTVAELMDELRFSFPLKTIFVNGRRIPKVEQEKRELRDGDEIKVVHMMSGG